MLGFNRRFNKVLNNLKKGFGILENENENENTISNFEKYIGLNDYDNEKGNFSSVKLY